MLTLPIKREWFDMIASGEKKEEYRDLTAYYAARLSLRGKYHIRYRNGYSRYSPLMECLVSVKVGTGKPEWGAIKNVEYFVITIHEKEVLPEAKGGPEEWD